SLVSLLPFFRANRAEEASPRFSLALFRLALDSRFFPQSRPRDIPSIADRPMTDAGAPRSSPDSAKPYRVLARKYRPSSFDDLIGQDALVRTVSNAFETGRIPQAWILTGVR